jgi:hypothetical protein
MGQCGCSTMQCDIWNSSVELGSLNCAATIRHQLPRRVAGKAGKVTMKHHLSGAAWFTKGRQNHTEDIEKNHEENLGRSEFGLPNLSLQSSIIFTQSLRKDSLAVHCNSDFCELTWFRLMETTCLGFRFKTSCSSFPCSRMSEHERASGPRPALPVTSLKLVLVQPGNQSPNQWP